MILAGHIETTSLQASISLKIMLGLDMANERRLLDHLVFLNNLRSAIHAAETLAFDPGGLG